MQVDYAKKIIATIGKIVKIKDSLKEPSNSKCFEATQNKFNGNYYCSSFSIFFESKDLCEDGITEEKFKKIVFEFLNDNKIQLLNKFQESLVTTIILEKQRMVADLVDDLSLINKF